MALFRVLIQAAFRRMGLAWDAQQLEADLARLEGWYLGGGWYCDGEPTQVDYYIPFGMHFYGLIYAWCMEKEEPERSRRLKERAAAFAVDYLYWFEDGGRAVPFGRSLTYRFGRSAFFAALAFAGVEALPWGVVKSRLLGNLRDWFAQPIFTADGLLTVGYGYPNLCMSENYNAPGFPSHRRSYVVTTNRPIDAADGGFSIPAEEDGRPYAEDMVEWTQDSVTARFPWETRGICCEQGGGTPLLVSAWPNTNLLHPVTRISTIRFHLEPGTHWLVTVVTGSVSRTLSGTNAANTKEVHGI